MGKRVDRPKKDLTNLDFGIRHVTGLADRRRGEFYWHYICACGRTGTASAGNLRAGGSCGCLRSSITAAFNRRTKVTHGLSRNGKRHPLRATWDGMLARCYEPKHEHYSAYGGRGIHICAEWLNNVQLFYDWAFANGWQRGLQIDRENNDGDYTPSNCRFVTRKVNSNNKRNNIYVVINGERMALALAVEKYSTVSYGTVKQRLYKKTMTLMEALKTPAGELPLHLKRSGKRNQANQLKSKS